MASSDSIGLARPIPSALADFREAPAPRRISGSLTPEARFRTFLLPFALVLAGLLIAVSGSGVLAQDAGSTPTAEVTPSPDAPRLELDFTELNDSGVSGTATLYEAGDRTIVELNLEDTGDNHPAHIHAGTCDDLQPEPAFPLENVRGDGASTTVVDTSLRDLIDGDFAIDLHLSPNELGTLVVCADIEGEPQVPDSRGTPQVPTGTPTTTTPTVAPTEAAPTATATEEPQPGNVIDESTPQPDETEDGTGGAINDSASSASVPLTSTSDLGVTGTAVLTAVDAQTTVISVVLSGDAVGSDAIVHLHDGTCDVAGDFTLDLNAVNDSGISETEVDLSLEELIADGYFINVHQSEAAYDSWFVCGEVTNATVGMVVPEVAPDTGASGTRAPTPTAAAAALTTPTAAVAGGTGDGTQGDIADSGKGVPLDPTTGLPITAGTGSSLPFPTSSNASAIWMMAAMSIVLLMAGVAIRASGSRRARSRSAVR